MSKKNENKLEIRQHRIFSKELKIKIVKQLERKQTTIRQVSIEHQVSHQAVYNWLYQYSQIEKPCTLVVQMNSEETKNIELLKRVADLERIIGQKQLEVDFLNKLMELGSKELGFDIKKNFSSQLLNGTENKKASK